MNKDIFDKKVTAQAILGIDGLKKVLLFAYNAVAKNKLMPFPTREEALDYLVEVDQKVRNSDLVV